MATQSQKRQRARAEHQKGKRRSRYRKLFEKYKAIPLESTREIQFSRLLTELLQLNIKYQQQLLSDLRAGYILPWAGDYHRAIISSIETSILERTILK